MKVFPASFETEKSGKEQRLMNHTRQHTHTRTKDLEAAIGKLEEQRNYTREVLEKHVTGELERMQNEVQKVEGRMLRYFTGSFFTFMLIGTGIARLVVM